MQGPCLGPQKFPMTQNLPFLVNHRSLRATAVTVAGGDITHVTRRRPLRDTFQIASPREQNQGIFCEGKA